jgi:hypothetical protein
MKREAAQLEHADEEEQHVVLEVDWMLRESDGKLTHNGWRRVTKQPKQTLMVEVLDGDKGIQDKVFLSRCERMMRLMRKTGLPTCVQPFQEELPSA